MVITWMGVIFNFSSMDTNKSNGNSKKLIYNVIKGTIDITNKISITNLDSNKEALVLTKKINKPIRKVAHATVYFILSIVLLLALKYFSVKHIYLYSLIVCFIYACTDEIHQRYVSGRTSSFKDVLIDTLGCIIGLLICYIIDKISLGSFVLNEEV